MSVERRYTESHIARLAAREKQQQQHFRPVISVHKWFARRPATLFRALALAELAEGRVDATFAQTHQLSGVCLDPMMGGGSPLFEASRLGLSVIGYDTNPMAAWVVERELEEVDPDELAIAGEAVAADVEAQLDGLYSSTCPDCRGTANVRYFFWVRHHVCDCGQEHPLLAQTQLVSTGLRRHPREVHICPSCLTLAEHASGKRPSVCPHCHEEYDKDLVAPGSLHACECGTAFRIPPQGEITHAQSRLVGLEYDCPHCEREQSHCYKTADADDHARYARVEALSAERPSPFWPTEAIPAGDETRRLHRWGYLQWCDLFNARQLYALGVLAARIAAEPDGPVKRALATCFSDILRFQNMLCRYDRQACKPTDAFAVHGFPVPRVSCEPALLGERGRGSGGFRHAVNKYERAKRWCRAPYETVLDRDDGKLRRIATPGESLTPRLVTRRNQLGSGGRALLRRGSLKPDELVENSVDIVLTDPPYFNNVHYGELMDFCYAWLRRLADSRHFNTARAMTDEDAVGGTAVDIAEFADRLSGVYTAAAAALKDGAPFIFTYHHNDRAAYAPLIVACLDGGLVPTKLMACPSEMRASKHIHGRDASTVDAVFVLRKPPVAADREDFGDPGRVVAGRLAALRRAGLSPTKADRACLHHAAHAMRAMVELTATWDASAPATDKLAMAFDVLTGGDTPSWPVAVAHDDPDAMPQLVP